MSAGGACRRLRMPRRGGVCSFSCQTRRRPLMTVGQGMVTRNGAVFTNRVASGRDSCYVRGFLGDIRRSTFPPRSQVGTDVHVRLAQILDLVGEDSWRNVYAGELEVRPPGAPTTDVALAVPVAEDDVGSEPRRARRHRPGTSEHSYTRVTEAACPRSVTRSVS
jgi:hypothetical protein